MEERVDSGASLLFERTDVDTDDHVTEGNLLLSNREEYNPDVHDGLTGGTISVTDDDFMLLTRLNNHGRRPEAYRLDDPDDPSSIGNSTTVIISDIDEEDGTITIAGTFYWGWPWWGEYTVRHRGWSNDPDENDPRRHGVRWEDLSLDDGSMDVYRKKQWDAASLPDPVISPLRSYRKLMDPPTDRRPVFPTFDQRTLATSWGTSWLTVGNARMLSRSDEYARDLLLTLDEDVQPTSITTDGTRSILRRLTESAGIKIGHPKHEYLAPHGGRRGMGEVLVRAFGYTAAVRYLDNSEEMVRERYPHIEAGELGDVATEALEEIDTVDESVPPSGHSSHDFPDSE